MSGYLVPLDVVKEDIRNGGVLGKMAQAYYEDEYESVYFEDGELYEVNLRKIVTEIDVYNLDEWTMRLKHYKFIHKGELTRRVYIPDLLGRQINFIIHREWCNKIVKRG